MIGAIEQCNANQDEKIVSRAMPNITVPVGKCTCKRGKQSTHSRKLQTV